MAGYGAVVSLQQTIERILESSRISLVPPSMETMQLAYMELEPLQKTLTRLDRSSKSKSRKKVNALDGLIKEAVWRFEDLLESHLLHQILSQLERDVLLFSIDLQSLQGDVHSFIKTVKDMETKYNYELHNMPQVEEDEFVSSIYDFDGMKEKMVGFSDLFEHAKNELIQEGDGNYYAYSLVGMPGSGKTTLAETIFEDSAVLSWFDHRVWVTVGRKYELNEIVRHVLAQVLDPHINETTQGDGKIHDVLKGKLEGKRCLIVLDNIWDTEVLDYLRTALPHKNSAVIRILLTTNLFNVAQHLLSYVILGSTRSMRPLNEKESEDLLREKVFGGENFPYQLKKSAKKIAKNCKGLPLMIVTVADCLLKANKNDDPQYWNEVAEHRNSGVMMNAHKQISKVLLPVYDCSPQSLKMLYLYLGAFPQDYEIPSSKLMILLISEGFLQRQTLDEIFNTKMQEFGRMSNVVIFKQSMSNYRYIKTCSLNPSWWHLLNKEASKDKFLRLLNSGVDGLQGQRRLCLHSNFLVCFKEVNDVIKCDCASTARSLLCFGPYHPYPIPLDVGFKLLRVLDALKVRFYDFPVEILELALLQYLALTYNGELPTSIPKLFNLQFLIIHPHVSIKLWEAPSTVPVQIWDMQELKHIEILGSNLPNPNCAVSLRKLSTLLGVSADSCTREVLTKLPNITKLGIQIELMPESGSSIPLSFFSSFAELKNLDTLKCSVVNPELEYGRNVAFLNPLWMIPSRLRKLHLSGMGYAWKDMQIIGLMPNLKVLKLRCYAFQGPKWETFGGRTRGSFLRLEYLVIEDTDLVQWEPGHGSFPKLHRLSIKHCYELEELRWPSAARSGVIEMVDCNPLAVACAKQLKPVYEHDHLKVISSFEELK